MKNIVHAAESSSVVERVNHSMKNIAHAVEIAESSSAEGISHAIKNISHAVEVANAVEEKAIYIGRQVPPRAFLQPHDKVSAIIRYLRAPQAFPQARCPVRNPCVRASESWVPRSVHFWQRELSLAKVSGGTFRLHRHSQHRRAARQNGSFRCDQQHSRQAGRCLLQTGRCDEPGEQPHTHLVALEHLGLLCIRPGPRVLLPVLRHDLAPRAHLAPWHHRLGQHKTLRKKLEGAIWDALHRLSLQHLPSARLGRPVEEGNRLRPRQVCPNADWHHHQHHRWRQPSHLLEYLSPRFASRVSSQQSTCVARLTLSTRDPPQQAAARRPRARHRSMCLNRSRTKQS
mmetsp:Transcript_25788/g.58620  ORF Transcript_25788/g.58620 Transcript_25788/m.58620 type:complete len:343 (-) Transcript_25788:183-1211(-)